MERANRFRKLVAEVEAVRASSIFDENAPAWIAKAVNAGVLRRDPQRDGFLLLTDPTSDHRGEVFVAADEWVIQGIAGELYPCKPDVFAQLYAPIEVAAPVKTIGSMKDILGRSEAGKITDRILDAIGDAQASALAKDTVEYEAVRQIVADVITAGQDAGREIVRLEREAALAAAHRESDAAVLRELGTDASKWAPAFMDALMATPEPTVEDDDRDLTKWMRDQEALTLAWFANAIEIGRDAGVRQERDRARAEPAIAGATTRGDIERNLAIAVDQVSETFDAARAGFPWHGDAILGTVRGAVADALDLIHTQGARIADGRVPCPPGSEEPGCGRGRAAAGPELTARALRDEFTAWLITRHKAGTP